MRIAPKALALVALLSLVLVAPAARADEESLALTLEGVEAGAHALKEAELSGQHVYVKIVAEATLSAGIISAVTTLGRMATTAPEAAVAGGAAGTLAGPVIVITVSAAVIAATSVTSAHAATLSDTFMTEEGFQTLLSLPEADIVREASKDARLARMVQEAGLALRSNQS